MKLYNSGLSPDGLRVCAVANELGIDLDIIEIDIMKGENETDAYLELNPNGKVPVLVDGDFILWESRAITAYLASLHPAQELYPTDPRQRAVVDQWSYWQGIHLGPAVQAVTFERFVKSKLGLGETDESKIEAQFEEIGRLLPILDANLAGKTWVADKLSVADFAMASIFMYRDQAGISLEKTPHVDAWIDRVEARPSWQTAVVPILALIAD